MNVLCETGIEFRHRLQDSRLYDRGLLRQDAVQLCRSELTLRGKVSTNLLGIT